MLLRTNAAHIQHKVVSAVLTLQKQCTQRRANTGNGLTPYLFLCCCKLCFGVRQLQLQLVLVSCYGLVLCAQLSHLLLKRPGAALCAAQLVAQLRNLSVAEAAQAKLGQA